MAEAWRGKIACMDADFIEKQRQHCFAEEVISDDGKITMWALGGFVPDEPEEAIPHLADGVRFKSTYAPPNRVTSIESQIRQENEYRLNLVVQMNQFIDALEKSGCTVKRASKISGINRRLSETLRSRVPAFAERWTEVYEGVTDELEKAGLKRAIKGVKKPIYFQGAKCGEETVYSDSLLSMMLQARRPAVYRNRTVQENIGVDPSGVMLVPVASDEDWEKMAHKQQQELKEDVRS